MRALTLTQPDIALAYLAGVIHGDGWLTSKALGLKVKDLDFAQAFATAIFGAFGHHRSPRPDGPYWRLSLSNVTSRFDQLRDVSPRSDICCAAWLRGLFDSEGNAQLTLHRHVGPSSYTRRVAMYSTNHKTLSFAAGLLGQLGIGTLMIRATKNSAGHKGTKVVYELAVTGSRKNYARFAELVGSSIYRKQATMKLIVEKYQADMPAHCREKQLKGAATKRAKTIDSTIPSVIRDIRARIDVEQSVTQRACAASIGGYSTARNYMTHAQLIAAAKAGAPFAR